MSNALVTAKPNTRTSSSVAHEDVVPIKRTDVASNQTIEPQLVIRLPDLTDAADANVEAAESRPEDTSLRQAARRETQRSEREADTEPVEKKNLFWNSRWSEYLWQVAVGVALIALLLLVHSMLAGRFPRLQSLESQEADLKQAEQANETDQEALFDRSLTAHASSTAPGALPSGRIVDVTFEEAATATTASYQSQLYSDMRSNMQSSTTEQAATHQNLPTTLNRFARQPADDLNEASRDRHAPERATTDSFSLPPRRVQR